MTLSAQLYRAARPRRDTAEQDFKLAVCKVVEAGQYPSAQRVHRARGHQFPRADLNGRECRWRREVCKEIGFRLAGRNL